MAVQDLPGVFPCQSHRPGITKNEESLSDHSGRISGRSGTGVNQTAASRPAHQKAFSMRKHSLECHSRGPDSGNLRNLDDQSAGHTTFNRSNGSGSSDSSFQVRDIAEPGLYARTISQFFSLRAWSDTDSVLVSRPSSKFPLDNGNQFSDGLEAKLKGQHAK